MSLKWTGSVSESGILRKSEFKEKKEELFVFGYSCKLFRDNDRALQIDQGKHLIPWMGDETLKIDRYDARGALHDLSALEAPQGGFDWRVELTKGELDVEQLCDEERYRALHTDEDEEEMYKEEELKRLHAAGYGQVGFNYEAPAEPSPVEQPTEVDEPFIPTPAFKALLSPDILLPESEKQNVIIEKTAKFIAEQAQGAQMEILIKAKQRDNPQFQFLDRESPLHPYYTALIALVKAGKWPEHNEVVEEKPHENEDYLHPSLASTVIESAPSIPSIHYKPSADCDYTMLISKMRGTATLDEAYTTELAPGEVPPPGTEPLPPRACAEISRAPVMYTDGKVIPPPPPPQPPQIPQQHQQQQYAAYYHQYMAQTAALQAQRPADEPKPALKSTGLSLMKNYNTDSDSDVSDCDDESSNDSKESIVAPPEDIRIVIDKMASYVARNGGEFADIVRAKGDPRFTFLEPHHQHHKYYVALLRSKRGEGTAKTKAPVSFSIKKLKEPDPILPKPALPYESSSDDESENKQTDKQTNNTDEKDAPKIIPQVYPFVLPPPAIVYKMEAPQNNGNEIKVQEIKQTNIVPTPVPTTPVPTTPVPEVKPKEEKPVLVTEKHAPKTDEVRITPEKKIEKKERKVERSREKKSRESKRESKTESRERKAEREKKRERELERVREEKRKKYIKDDLENEIISLEDNSDEMIDLTGDQSDSKVEADGTERVKQQERRRRAAEFLRKVGVDPGAAALPTSSLASAMVDTLENIRKKKAEEEEKRRRREKRRHRDRHGYEEDGDRSHRKNKRRKYKSSDENDESDCDSSKKKKRKKDKKTSKSKKKRRRETAVEEEIDHPLPPNIDLTSTLKELRTSSPTKELCIQEVEESVFKEDSSEDEEVNRRINKKKKEDREYSEGEWSDDSEEDSGSSPSRNGD